jgi:hypothetical protein
MSDGVRTDCQSLVILRHGDRDSQWKFRQPGLVLFLEILQFGLQSAKVSTQGKLLQVYKTVYKFSTLQVYKTVYKFSTLQVYKTVRQ